MSKPRIIAQIVQHLAPGGIESMVIELQQNAIDSDTVHIISLQGEKADSVKAWKRLEHLSNLHFLGKKQGLSLQTLIQLKKLLKKLNADVVHTHHAGPLIYGGIAAKLAKCKHIHTEHDAWHLNSLKQRLLVGGFFHLLKPTVIAISNKIAHQVAKVTAITQPEVIFNGINLEYFLPDNQSEARRKIKLPEHITIIGCAARLNAVKCQDRLITALAELPESVHLALAGDGELKQTLMELAHQLRLENRVHMLGNIEDMPAFYNAIDVFCLTSDYEGLPLSILEAQACQKTVAVTDVGSCHEGVDKSSGSVISNGDQKKLTEVLKRHINYAKSNVTGISARVFVHKKFNLKNMVKQYHLIYQGAA